MRDNDDHKQNFNPRHRIVGAIILVSLAVIFLPMILDERKQPSLGINQISEIPRPSAKTAVSAALSASNDAPQAIVATRVAQPPSDKDASEKTVYRLPSQDKKTEVTRTESVEKGWFVQVGTFSNSDNARQLADKLKQDGFAVQLENIRLAKGKAVRVRVGPFLEDNAKVAQLNIEKSVGIKGVILAYQ
jgi:DedD protein